MANIRSSVELITSNSKKMHIASSTRELTTSNNKDGYYDEEEDDFYHGDRSSDYYRLQGLWSSTQSLR
ncbi:hypothetical protein D6D02_03383 [Aureobasidium pullulans]|uniref:Uncharacterized protein n=1 Tax=Aureobasidium pullulans TaxID=5580 RepID=A0A4S8UVJ7_AURPU|nr:hypothetical protein D6D26_04169 [Aureobasidium pullulans]THW09120.1 hypothetical protein D6D24_08646 [Aureobasidium pullulans]THY16977.1 hypothetical protein D6D02_03383 [Aureobasidium pullulans]THY96034.1 hypothetical protein D6C93_04870 [Aureobasidium pullulans]